MCIPVNICLYIYTQIIHSTRNWVLGRILIMLTNVWNMLMFIIALPNKSFPRKYSGQVQCPVSSTHPFVNMLFTQRSLVYTKNICALKTMT